jgi:hypothetical protein
MSEPTTEPLSRKRRSEVTDGVEWSVYAAVREKLERDVKLVFGIMSVAVLVASVFGYLSLPGYVDQRIREAVTQEQEEIKLLRTQTIETRATAEVLAKQTDMTAKELLANVQKTQEALVSARSALDTIGAQKVDDIKKTLDAIGQLSSGSTVGLVALRKELNELQIRFSAPTEYGYGPSGGFASCDKPGEVVVGVGSGNNQNNRVRCAKIDLPH